jgi:hypothetical protein
MNSFEELLKKQQSTGLQGIVDAAKKASSFSEGGFKDDRIWKPVLDKSGTGSALIRFLPTPDSEIPWAKYYEHSFKSPISNRWFWEKCPTTIGGRCPVCEENSKKWNAGVDSLKEVARSRKRRLHYASNIVVLQENAVPENNGKVFIFVYGAKIFNKLMSAMEPEFDDESPFNPFNLFSGAPFKLKIRTVEGFSNYDASEFGSNEPLYGGDQNKLRAIFEKLYSLKEYTDPTTCKPYEELRKIYFEVTGESDTSMLNVASIEETQFKSKQPKFETTTINTEDSGIDDDDLAYFQRLAAES